jgi:outer membrane protein
MNRSLVLAISLASALAAGAQLQAPPTSPAAAPAGPAKIAVIAFKAAVAQTNEGQRDLADLEKKFMPRENQLKALNDEIETLTKQLQTQAATLNDAERASRAKTIDDKKKKLERDAGDARNDFQQEMGEVYNTLASKVYDVMSGYAQQAGYTLILDVSDQQSPVLFATQNTDISRAVVEAYNVKSGVPAPPAPPAGAPGAQARPNSAPAAPMHQAGTAVASSKPNSTASTPEDAVMDYLAANEPDGWHFSREQSVIKDKLIDQAGGKASMKVQAVFGGGGTYMQNESKFFVSRTNGGWAVTRVDPPLSFPNVKPL